MKRWMIKSQVFVVVETYYDGCNAWETTVKAFADKDEAEYHALELQEARLRAERIMHDLIEGSWGEDRSWDVKTLDVY